MKISKFAAAIAAVSLLFCSGGMAFAKPGAAAYGAHAKIRGLTISPEGGYVAMTSDLNDQDVITISKVGGGHCNVGNGGNNVRGMYWGNEGRLVVVATRTTKLPDDWRDGSDEMYEIGQSFSVGANCADIKMMKGHDFLAHLSNGKVLMTVQSFNNSTSADKNLRRAKKSFFKTDIFEVDPVSGDSHLVEPGKDLTQGWIVNGAGEAKIRIDWDERVDRAIVFARVGGSMEWVQVYDGRGLADIDDQLDFLAVGSRADTAYVRTRNGGDRFGIFEFDLRKGAISRTIFQSVKVDVVGLDFDEYSGVPVGAVYLNDEAPTIEYFDRGYAQMDADLVATFPGEDTNIGSVTRDRKKYIAYVEGANNPGGVYHFVDMSNSEIFEIGRRHPGLTTQDVGPVKFFTYAARDGLSIPAYLTLPYGSAGKNLPLVVMPHGGPEARDGNDFDGWSQFLASRGYAVLQPQFRGSDGFGKAFRDAGHYKWGLAMQDDITDGVKNLIANGVADGNRVCIIGWSYGGYATLAGMTLTPELYKCGVAGAPVSDLPKMLDWVRKRMGRDLRPDDYWSKRIGMVNRDSERLAATSPARHADKIQAPILLVHAKNDTTVPFEQSEIMLDAMKKAGKVGELVSIDGDDHYLSKSTTGIQFLERLESFIGQHLQK